jgi:hypothetical protein
VDKCGTEQVAVCTLGTYLMSEIPRFNNPLSNYSALK